MADIELIDKSLIQSKTFQYHLSIQADLDGVCFSILDKESNRYLLFRKYSYSLSHDPEIQLKNVDQAFSTDEFLQSGYSTVSFIYLTRKSTLVPGVFFDESNIRTYFEFNHSLNEYDEIHYNYISEIEGYNIFTIPSDLSNFIYSKHKNVKYFHQATPLIHSVIAGLHELSGIHINLNRDFFDIVVIENSRLRLYNTFQYQNDTDLLYFVLYVIKQLKIDIASVITTICGEQCDKPAYYNALKEYIPNIVYLEPVFPEFSPVFKKIGKHKFFNLFYLFNCG